MVAVRRFLSLPGECLASATEAVIEVPLPLVAGMALELTLLLEGLSESLRLRPSAGPMLVLTMLDKDNVSKAIATKDDAGAIRFALGRNQVGYLQAVLLRAFRDQMAEVNHVHVEAVLEGSLFDLTVMFDVSREPMSPEEVDKLMAEYEVTRR